ncbi:MAG: hypothetical protein ACE37J_10280 [Pikeienuella sp.]|uniref:hypothetical protein n=1 Tax=Pikeienuella sp. TaxID=2831957 RepID=UPI00391CD615
MKPIILAAAAAAALAAASAAAEERKLVSVVTTPEPQTQLMAMVLTMQAVQQGAKAHVLLCGPGGDLALRDAPASATAPQPPRDMSPQGLMGKIMEAGAIVEVCAIYLPGKGAGPEALIDGVGVAQPPAMAGAMMDPETRVWSF